MARPHADNEPSGLGPEMVDESTRIAEVEIDEVAQTELEKAQTRGLGYWVLLAVVVVVLAEQTSFSFTLYSYTLGEFAALYPTSNVVWVMTGLVLGSAVVVPLLSKLGDVYGKRRMISWSVLILCIGCLVCALAPNYTILIVGRVLMSGSAALVLLALSLVREVFPVKMRAVVIAVVSSGGGIIIIIGPMLSAWLTETWGVQATFYFQFVMAAVAGTIAYTAIPETPIRVKAKIDLVGASLLGIGAFGVVGGLTQLQTLGWGRVTVGFTALGVVALVAWFAHMRRASDPLINLRLLERRPLATPIIAMALISGCVAMVNVLIVLNWSTPSQLAPYGRGLDPMKIAFWSIPYSVIFVAMGFIVGLTVRSIGYQTHLIFGGVCVALSAGLMGILLDAPSGVVIAVSLRVSMSRVHWFTATPPAGRDTDQPNDDDVHPYSGRGQ